MDEVNQTWELERADKRIDELDGLRGVAISTVLVYHWFVIENRTLLPGYTYTLGQLGWTGVDLFFVLSGFLIGGILLDNKAAPNLFRVFYARRFFRIVPLYLALLLTTHVALWSAYTSGTPTHDWLFKDILPWYIYLTFSQNIWMVVYNVMNARIIDATWSLAVEEQFYLTLPFLVRFIRRQHVPLVLISGAALAPIVRVLFILLLNDRGWLAIYVLAPCRMDALLLGSLAAWLVRHPPSWLWIQHHRFLVWTVFWLSGSWLCLATLMHWGQQSLHMQTVGYSIVAIFYTSLLIAVLLSPQGELARLLRNRLLRSIGSLAYFLYLFHQPVLGLTHLVVRDSLPRLTDAASLLTTLSALVLLLAAARLSWHVFERPLIRRGYLSQYSRAAHVDLDGAELL